MSATPIPDAIAQQRKEHLAALDLAMKQKAEIENTIQRLGGGLAVLDLVAAKLAAAKPASTETPKSA